MSRRNTALSIIASGVLLFFVSLFSLPTSWPLLVPEVSLLAIVVGLVIFVLSVRPLVFVWPHPFVGLALLSSREKMMVICVKGTESIIYKLASMDLFGVKMSRDGAGRG